MSQKPIKGTFFILPLNLIHLLIRRYRFLDLTHVRNSSEINLTPIFQSNKLTIHINYILLPLSVVSTRQNNIYNNIQFIYSYILRMCIWASDLNIKLISDSSIPYINYFINSKFYTPRCQIDCKCFIVSRHYSYLHLCCMRRNSLYNVVSQFDIRYCCVLPLN